MKRTSRKIITDNQEHCKEMHTIWRCYVLRATRSTQHHGDNETGSPMQCLMSRQAYTLEPISDTLQMSCIIEPNLDSTRLMKNKQKQTFNYDQTAKPRPQCGAGDSILIQTPDGWKPATYVSTSVHSRHGRENPMILEKKTAIRVHTCTRNMSKLIDH